MKNIKKNRFKLIMSIVFIMLVVVLGFCIFDILKILKSTNGTKVEVLDTIEEYNYTLNENDSAYFKEEFKELKKLLSKSDIDEEKYAESISKLFVIDFFSIDSSINKNDVGGIQFIYTDYQQDFIKSAKSSIYKYVENNIYGDRKQELPIVKKVEVTDIVKKSAEYEKENDKKAYYVELDITYEKDLEYPEKVNLVLIHSNNKLEIAEMN